MEISATATNGERCCHERHRFRIGVDAEAATEFAATRGEFLEALTNALVDHGQAKRPTFGGNVYLQVRTLPEEHWRSWHNIQNPETGGVLMVTPDIVAQEQVADRLFMWACNAVQMVRDLMALADGLARNVEE